MKNYEIVNINGTEYVKIGDKYFVLVYRVKLGRNNMETARAIQAKYHSNPMNMHIHTIIETMRSYDRSNMVIRDNGEYILFHDFYN